jgi:DNA modification methylase
MEMGQVGNLWELVMKSFHDGKVALHAGDCLDVLKAMPENSIDAVVTDPPYHLTSIVKRFGGANAAPAKGNEAFIRASKGFMGKVWDGGDIAFNVELWAEVLRVLKPGGHMVCFGGTRTYHRMVCAIEDAGFEVRDQLAYCFGSGFPKSHNISRNLDEVRCGCGSNRTESEHDLQGVRSRDVSSPVHASKGDREILFQSLQEHSSSAAERKELPDYAGADEPCMEGRGDVSQEARELCERPVRAMSSRPDANGEAGRICNGAPLGDGDATRQAIAADGMRPSSRSQSAEQRSNELGTVAMQQEPQKRRAWENCERCGKPIIPDGLGTALKPAWEPICLARKPLSESTVAANVMRWGTGAINIDGCRVDIATGDKGNWPITKRRHDDVAYTLQPVLTDQTKGRWPANLCHDGSPEVMAGFPDAGGGYGKRGGNEESTSYGFKTGTMEVVGFGDSGSAARFFYTAKADADDRLGSKHPTVKPVDLMQWLVRLVCPKGATALDPFAGTGTTGAASFIEGRQCVLIEREAEYLADIEKRMELLLSGPDERARKLAKPGPFSALPLFALSED